MNASDMREFIDYLRACTNEQVEGVLEKEITAGRADYAQLAMLEAERRELHVWPGPFDQLMASTGT